MVEKYVHREPVIIAQVFDGNPQGLLIDKDSGLLWFNLFNSGQAKYDTEQGMINLELESSNGSNPKKAEIHVGDFIVYYQGVNPPVGGVSEIIRIDKSRDFRAYFETLENRNNRLTRTGVSYE